MKRNKKMIGNLKSILKFSFPSFMILISTPSYALQSNFTFVHSAWMGGLQSEYVTNKLTTKSDFTYNTPDLPGHRKDKTSPTSIEFNDYVEQSVGVNAVELRAAISANHRLFKSNVQQHKFEAFMEGASLSKIYRLYDNGSQVIAHFETTRDGKPSAEFILLNTKEGKPSSFWAAKQMVPENQVQNRTMFDGEINIDHTANTTKNKTTIERWLNDVWIQGKSEQISRYFNNGKVIQHNPHVKDNVDGLYELAENNIHIRYTEIVDIFAIGDFVLTFSKGKMNQNSIWVADLFRLKNEKIAEHWDVIEFK